MSIGSDQLLEGFGLRPGIKNLDNQLLILTSWSLIDKTLHELPFGIEYYVRGRINKVAFYPESPIRIFVDSSYIIPRDIEFKLKMLDDTHFSVAVKRRGALEKETKGIYGDTIELSGGRLRIEKIYGKYQDINAPATIYFMLHSHEKLVESYKSRLKAITASKEGTIIRLSLDGTNRKMDIDFLNKLIDVFLNNNLERKNLEAVRTINFIESQLSGISDSLTITEDRLQKFRSANKVMDMSAQGQQIINQAMALENEKAKLVIESNYYEYLADYLNKDMSGELPISPATMGITDPGLGKLVIELADLQSQYFSNSMTDRNPMKAQIAQRLRNTRDALNETLKGVRHANELAMRENGRQIRTINASAVTLPKTERELLGFQREFKLNDVLYSFLIEKMAEAQIQKASNTPDNEVVDNARQESGVVSPKFGITYLLALLMGIGVPIILIYIIKAFSNIIKDDEELRRICDLPVTGYIPHSLSTNPVAVLDDKFSFISESFRSLRTRLQFMTKEIKSPVILVTSSMPSEGKTFTAINLAAIYSLMGKKVALLEFDLRRPKIYSSLGIKVEKGLSTWLIGQNAMDEITIDSGYENLNILPAGPIPPNPAELIESSKTLELLALLKEKYDYIIIDSAPVGTVSDSVQLARISDATIVVVRIGRTIAPLLANSISNITENGINSLSLLVNDISNDARKYKYGYRYGYKYGYRYAYGNEYYNKYTSVK